VFQYGDSKRALNTPSAAGSLQQNTIRIIRQQEDLYLLSWNSYACSFFDDFELACIADDCIWHSETRGTLHLTIPWFENRA
jgi:hypothetical protein